MFVHRVRRIGLWVIIGVGCSVSGSRGLAAAPGQRPVVVYAEDFEQGVPPKWKGAMELSAGLPAGSKRAVAAVPGENLVSADAWVNGYFKIEKELYVNYWVRMDNPQWYQFFIFCKAPGPAAKDMSLYEAKPPVPKSSGAGWRLVSLPMSAFRGTMGPNKGKAPQPGQVCWRYFWGFQKRELGFAVDRFWVTRGGPVGDTPPPVKDVRQSVAAAPAPTWAFDPERDRFSPEALLDLRSLNEGLAGEHGWIRKDRAGDFMRGDGKPIRFWAVNTGVGREKPFRPRPRWGKHEPDLDHFARWLAKRGVNMVRCHAHLNPDLKKHPTAPITSVNKAECEWIWRTVAAMKRQGIYTTVSPYWANSMQSDDKLWGTDWGGRHHGLLFFDKTLQAAYKQWLKVLFTTPAPELGGRTLAEEPALAIFQIQNEDSLLFWTVNNLKGGPRRRLGRRFAAWVRRKYGSFEKAYAAWNNQRLEGDRPGQGILDFVNIWHMTRDARAKKQPDTPRCHDQVEFWTETMRAFNREIAEYIRNTLHCNVLINPGNWKTADTVLLNDAERYSYTAGDVLAVNRYFGGMHEGRARGWAVVKGDRYRSDSVLTSKPLGFPLNLKQAAGYPMLVTEGSWVFPSEFAAEGPFLVAAYGALTGFDGYYWFAAGTDEWTPPRSANGYMPSMAKWICLTPDMAGLFPAAALAYRRGYIRTGAPVVVEYRPLTDLWRLRTPRISEESGFDPNRDIANDAGGGPGRPSIDPFAFFVGPVRTVFAPGRTQVADLAKYIRSVPNGRHVRSITGEIELNTGEGWCTVNAPKVQGVVAHFRKRRRFELADVSVECGNSFGSVMAISLDDKPLSTSRRVLVQVGMPCRPTGWRTRPGAGKGVKVILDYGRAPWRIVQPDVQLRIANPALTRARVLDPNGMPTRSVSLKPVDPGGERLGLTFPRDALYVILDAGLPAPK
ncbi:MAG: hypothetical protein GXP31_01225 [Kiritimatiellaeota bacterium]|nr:hypothetical protein [Kiritimatiellota bacterium]